MLAQMPQTRDPQVVPEVDSTARPMKLIPQALSEVQARGSWSRRSGPFVWSERRHIKSSTLLSSLSVSNILYVAQMR
jgi:hypothetical protein